MQTLKKHYDQLPKCIKALVGLFEIELHVCQGQFDAAIETFNVKEDEGKGNRTILNTLTLFTQVYLNLESHSFVVLERMICKVNSFM